MTHAAVPVEARLAIGLTDSLIRLSIGIEDTKDIVNDIKNALDASLEELQAKSEPKPEPEPKPSKSNAVAKNNYTTLATISVLVVASFISYSFLKPFFSKGRKLDFRR